MCLLVLILSTGLAVGAASFELTGLSIHGGTSLLLRTNGTAISYSSTLSEDKKRLSIVIKNTIISSEVRQLDSPSGLIESAFLQRNGRDAILNVYLRDKVGFTAVLLPYSRAISIDVFRWNSLSASEDKYRSGLIALQSNAMSVAKDLLASASQLKHPDATAFAGFISAREGNFPEAKEYLLKALESKSSYADVYGGLAQVSREEKNEVKAREYENEFVKRMSRPPYFDEERLKIQKIAPPISEPSSLAFNEDVKQNPVVDSAKQNVALSSEQSTDSLMQQLRAMQGEKVAAKSDSISSASSSESARPQLFQWVNAAILGVGFALILIGLFFIRGYRTWKKQQLHYLSLSNQQQRVDGTFGSNLQHAMAVSDQHAVNVYKRAGSLVDSLDDDESEIHRQRPHTGSAYSLENHEQSQRNVVEQDTLDLARSKESPKLTEKEKSSELFDFDESFYSSRGAAAKQSLETSRSESRTISSSESPIYNTRADAQLSSESPLVTPNDASAGRKDESPLLDVDAESLEMLAKQLGIDASLLASVRKKSSQVKI